MSWKGRPQFCCHCKAKLPLDTLVDSPLGFFFFLNSVKSSGLGDLVSKSLESGQVVTESALVGETLSACHGY